jgi:uncharacterized protein DUF4253
MPAMDIFTSNADSRPADPTYHRLLAAAATTGRCPVCVADDRTDPRADRAAIMAELDTRDASEVLSARWPGGACACCDERLDPFRDGFPGLLQRPAVAPEEATMHAVHVVAETPHLPEPDLVEAVRPADVPAVIGWMGSYNCWQDTVGMSTVLRSWERRFGAVLYRLTNSTLELAVAAPPVTEDESLHVAAEHIAFCWDAFETYTGQMTTDTLRQYARRLRGTSRWRFWWD